MAIEQGDPIYICEEHGPSCQLDYPLRLMATDWMRAVLRPQRAGRVRNSNGGKSWMVQVSDLLEARYPTRAQAAQAVWQGINIE